MGGYIGGDSSMLGLKMPNRRVSKRQIACYLDEEDHRKIVDWSNENDLTFQQVLAMSINTELKDMGIEFRLSCEKLRKFIRKNKVASKRERDNVASTRRGKKNIAGWYERNEVIELRGYLGEKNVSVEEVIKNGFKKMLNGHDS